MITGEINEGKTGEMISIYQDQYKKKGDGFISKKIFIDDRNFSGYEIVRLSTNEKIPLAYHSQYVPPSCDEIYTCGPFHFSKAAIIFAENIIDDIIARNIEPVFIDEIGPLELGDKGFASLLIKTLKTRKDVYITVRNHCIEDVVKKFNIHEHQLIKIKKRSTDYTD